MEELAASHARRILSLDSAALAQVFCDEQSVCKESVKLIGKIPIHRPRPDTHHAHYHRAGAIMNHELVRGNIVRYSSIACYTGVPYTIHCLVLSVNPYDVTALVLNDDVDEVATQRRSEMAAFFQHHFSLPSPFPKILQCNVYHHNHDEADADPADAAVDGGPELTEEKSKREICDGPKHAARDVHEHERAPTHFECSSHERHEWTEWTDEAAKENPSDAVVVHKLFCTINRRLRKKSWEPLCGINSPSSKNKAQHVTKNSADSTDHGGSANIEHALRG